MSQTKAQLLDNIKDNVQLDARNSLRFADTDSSHYVAFKAPATVSSNVTWTLPAADGSANYVLATDGSGTLSWIADPAGQWTTSGSNIYFTGGNVGIGDSSPSYPLSVTGVASFNGDVAFTGASYDVVWDKSDNALEFADNAKLMIGTGDDFYITGGGTGAKLHANNGVLEIEGDSVQIWNAAANEAMAKFTADGAVQLYNNNVEMFYTSASGCHVGSPSAAAHLHFLDGGIVRLGASNDLELYHSGDWNYIKNNNEKNLAIQVKNGDENAIVALPDGEVQLYHNNVKKFETTSTGVQVSGKFKQIESGETTLTIGSSDAGGAYLLLDGDSNGDGAGGDYAAIGQDTSGNLIIQSRNPAGTGNITLKVAGTESAIVANANGAVELYYDNSKKLFTTGDGVQIIDDSSHQLEIKRSGSATQQAGIKFIDGGDATGRIIGYSGHVQIGVSPSSNSYEEAIMCNANGSVDLYYDGTKMVETTADGCTVQKGLTVKGLEGGDAQIRINADEQDDYADIYRLVTEASGGLSIQNLASGSWETNLKAIGDGAVEIYHNNAKKMESDSFGISIQGDCLKVPDGSAANPGFTFNNEGGADTGIFRPGADTLAFSSGGSERVRIESNGNLTTCGADFSSRTVAGFTARAGDSVSITRATGSPMEVNRQNDDGALIQFYQGNSSEGNISVSGSTVSYNGGHLSRWSQIKGLSKTDKSARPTIYQGTVMSNLDDLCEWEGEENQQLNMTKISDVDGDKDVAGVFWAWDDDDDTIVNDFYIAMTGDMVIRVAASTTVARGDLLISAGDGTAKPQADDIIRSSTIAKIISTNSTATYADGSKAYPCVLMAC